MVRGWLLTLIDLIDGDGKAVLPPTFTIPPPATKASRGSGKSLGKSRKRKAEIDDSPLAIRFPKAKKTSDKDKYPLSQARISPSPEPASSIIAAAETPTRTLQSTMELSQVDNYEANPTPPTPAYSSVFGTPEEEARRQARLQKLDHMHELEILQQGLKDDAESARLDLEARKAQLKGLDKEEDTVMTELRRQEELARTLNKGSEQGEVDAEVQPDSNVPPEKDNGLQGALGGLGTETEARDTTPKKKKKGGDKGRGKKSGPPPVQSRRRSTRTRNEASYQDD